MCRDRLLAKKGTCVESILPVFVLVVMSPAMETVAIGLNIVAKFHGG